MDRIIRDFLEISKYFKIYIYDFYPSNFDSLENFINHTLENKNYEWGETYKSWIYFMDYLIKSNIYTNDPLKAHLFLVPQWENLNWGNNYYQDLLFNLEKAVDSKYYKNTHPKRNHIFIYTSDDTLLYDERIPENLKNHLRDRFIRITYSGRIRNFGKFHNNEQTDEIFNFDYSNEIVVPPGIPVKNYIKKKPKKNAINNILYKGTFTPPQEQIERIDVLKYMTMNFEINDNDDSYFGIHCAGYGIWTARFYNYLGMGVIPISFSDGVIMPFEEFFNYQSFSMKILSSSVDSNNQDFVHKIDNICNIVRKYSNDNDNDNEYSIQEKEEKKIANLFFSMQKNVKEIFDWFDWKSKIPFKNPFTLIIIELYNRYYNNYKINENNLIAKEEFYNLNNENLPLYK
jgi:hypothetical protein